MAQSVTAPRAFSVIEGWALYRAYRLDLWLFIRRVSRNAAASALLLLLVLCATVLYTAEAWPGATFLGCLVRALYMLTIEGVEPPRVWYLEILILVMPVLGLIFAAEGLVGATVLFLNKSQRQGEWNAVIAATYSGHTVVCGLGQLGGTICQGPLAVGRKVVGVDSDEDLPGVVTARRQGVPVIIGDVTQQDTLEEANVAKASAAWRCAQGTISRTSRPPSRPSR